MDGVVGAEVLLVFSVGGLGLAFGEAGRLRVGVSVIGSELGWDGWWDGWWLFAGVCVLNWLARAANRLVRLAADGR